MSGPLEGVRVLDLSRLLPGPLCTHLLRRLGATVVKVEPPGGGDYTRYVPPLVEPESGRQHGALFEAVQAGKQGIALNLKHPDGAAALKRLVTQFDVLVEGFRPGVMARLGLGYEVLAEVNPALVYCAITGYGQDGPLALRAGHDLNYMALAGLLDMTGAAGERPPTPGFQAADAAGGSLQATIGILAALLEARSTGAGQLVDISMTEGVMALAMPALAAALVGETPPRGANMLDGGSPCYRVYTTADDRHLSLGALEPQFWGAFCERIGRGDLKARQPLLGGPTDPIHDELETVIAQRNLAEWVELLADVDGCAEGLLHPNELVDHPQHQARNVVLEGTVPQLVVGPRLSRHPAQRLPPAPKPGENTDEVLKNAGFTEAEIATLMERGAAARS